MIRACALCVFLAFPAATLAANDPVAAAEEAAQTLADAAGLLVSAKSARNKVAALTETIRAYEDGLAAMREGLRRAALREREIQTTFDAQSETLSSLLAVLLSMQTSPETLALLHPAGPVANARAGMMVSDVTPEIEREARMLKSELQEMAVLRSLQNSALDTLQDGLDGAQSARASLSQAISDRVSPSDQNAADQATLQALINSAETLQGFAASLATVNARSGSAETTGFEAQRGVLPLPVDGPIIGQFNGADAAGVRRPGLLVATLPRALVQSPWAATVRYQGPLLDYGQVVILEPEVGYLLVLSGMAEAFGEEGSVVEAGAPVGLMGGAAPDAQQILIDSTSGSGQKRTETLYIELRQGDAPVDPAQWFTPATE